MYRKTYALINKENIKNNVKNVVENYSEYDYFFGVVKGNAYGHGIEIIDSLIEAGVNYLAVSSLDEALQVRKINKEILILCFGYIDLEYIDVAAENNITVTIISYEYFNKLLKLNKNIKVHLKINSGMNRLGVKDKNQVKEIVDKIQNSNMELEGIYTHYGTSGVSDVWFDKQTRNFEEITSLIDLNKIKIVHLFNSLALVKHDKLSYANGVRLGIIMYGYSSSFKFSSNIKKIAFNIRKTIKLKGKKVSKTNLSNNLKLKKAFELHSEVVAINKVSKGEVAGYRESFKAKEDCLIAVVCIGHADGINKYFEFVKINNKKYKIVALCMDVILVLVDDEVKVNDDVVLINDELTISEIAEKRNISIHSVLVSFGSRVDRVYKSR